MNKQTFNVKRGSLGIFTNFGMKMSKQRAVELKVLRRRMRNKQVFKFLSIEQKSTESRKILVDSALLFLLQQAASK